jgi:glycosyltransferase involved in cell wall biosynthesis
LKKILFFGELPPKTIHGASISNLINIQMLRKHFDVKVIEEFSNLRFHNKFSVGKIYSFIKSLIDLIKVCFNNKFDYLYCVIYLSTFGIFKNILVAVTFKIFYPKSKILLHFHRSDFNKFINVKSNLALFKFLNLFTHEYITLSEFQKKTFPFTCKLSTLYNTIQLEFSNLLSRNANKDYILFVGNYIEEKGIFDLIQAVKKYNFEKQVPLKLVCHGNIANPIFFEKIKKHVEGDNTITLNGPIYDEKKMECIKNAKFLILPSCNEGMPLTLLESLSVGTPIIITKVGFISEALGEDYPLYCDIGNSDSIIKCFENFNKIDNIIDFGEKLEKIYRIKFSHKIHEVQLLTIFNK